MITNEQTIELLKENHVKDSEKEKSDDKFIAKLYSYELNIFKNHWKEENLNTILLENAIWLTRNDEISEKGCLDSEHLTIIGDFIMDEINRVGVKTTFKDRAILHAIFNSDCRHNMDYYVSKGSEFERQFNLEISEYARLKEKENEYWATNDDLGGAFIEGRDKYLFSIPNKKPITKCDCPYAEGSLKEAWLNGYSWSELEDKLCSALMQI